MGFQDLRQLLFVVVAVAAVAACSFDPVGLAPGARQPAGDDGQPPEGRAPADDTGGADGSDPTDRPDQPDAGDDAATSDVRLATDDSGDTGIDAGAPDAGAFDVGGPDAGTPDIGTADAFDVPDVPDVSDVSDLSDLSDVTDAGWEDFGLEDAGAPGTGDDLDQSDRSDPSDRSDLSPDAGCIPDCTGRVCGDDGCGGICGVCNDPPQSECLDPSTIREHDPAGTCTTEGLCEYPFDDRSCEFGCAAGLCQNCTPDCTGRDCGLDGCGGSCGSCDTCKNICEAGLCTAAQRVSAACDPAGDVVWQDSCGIAGDLKEACVSGQVCLDAACCTPDCAGKCGGTPDGCGGTCNGCPPGALCQGTSCAPCGGRTQPCCGGACDVGGVCLGGTCVPTDCAGLADLTPCLVVTDPDRSHDVCSGGVCVSPGCGDASCNADGPFLALPDTGARVCHDGAGPIACPVGAGSPCDPAGTPPFCGQDAQYGWDAAHPGSDRFVKEEAVGGQPTVRDGVTGLTWQGCTAGLSGASCAQGSLEKRTWADALAYCDSLSWGGRDDWRLPGRLELQSIADYGRIEPSADVAAFPGTPFVRFWTSASHAGAATYAWALGFDLGQAHRDHKSTIAAVRCAAGSGLRTQDSGLRGPDRFDRTEPVSGEPLVLDNITGLVWQGCPDGTGGGACEAGAAAIRDWGDALGVCEALAWGGHSDWRLPDLMELSSIVDDRRENPSIDPSAFPGTIADYFWSSTPFSGGTKSSAFVSFSDGSVFFSGRMAPYNVRCVRSGP